MAVTSEVVDSNKPVALLLLGALEEDLSGGVLAFLSWASLTVTTSSNYSTELCAHGSFCVKSVADVKDVQKDFEKESEKLLTHVFSKLPKLFSHWCQFTLIWVLIYLSFHQAFSVRSHPSLKCYCVEIWHPHSYSSSLICCLLCIHISEVDRYLEVCNNAMKCADAFSTIETDLEIILMSDFLSLWNLHQQNLCR